MIDIHSHILPGIDDGPADITESVKMAKIASKDGIRTIVATPHCFDGAYNCESVDIEKCCTQLNQRLQDERIAIEVLPGAEIRLTPEVVESVKKHGKLALGYTNTLLIELPEMFMVDGVVRQLQSLQQIGYDCVIAHPERNSQILSRPIIVDELVYAGAAMQITATSLQGDFGGYVKDCALKLLQKDADCYIATDSHCTRKRKPKLKKALKIATKAVGRERAGAMVEFDLEMEFVTSRKASNFS